MTAKKIVLDVKTQLHAILVILKQLNITMTVLKNVQVDLLMLAVTASPAQVRSAKHAIPLI